MFSTDRSATILILRTSMLMEEEVVHFKVPPQPSQGRFKKSHEISSQTLRPSDMTSHNVVDTHQVFRRNLMPASPGEKRARRFLPKRWYLPTKLHGVAFQKTVIITFTSVENLKGNSRTPNQYLD